MGNSGVYCKSKINKNLLQTILASGVVRGVFVRGASKIGENFERFFAFALVCNCMQQPALLVLLLVNEAKSLKIAPPN